MFSFFQNFEFDGRSFLLGLISGSLLWFVLNRLRRVYAQLFSQMKQGVQSTQKELKTSTEIRLGNDMLRQAQTMHIASTLFSLEEVLVPPKFMSYPAQTLGGEEVASITDISEAVLPYLPDWPEFPVQFATPRISLAEALSLGANLVITGPPGSGKTVALANLTIQLVRRDPACASLAERVPLLVQVADLHLLNRNPENLLGPLTDAISGHVSTMVLPALARYIKATFENQRALLLLDGLDELPPESAALVLAYLDEILSQYPATRCVLSGHGNYSGLARHGFAVLAVASWDNDQRRAFLGNWGEIWSKYIAGSGPDVVQPMMIAGWVQTNTNNFSPLELTLKAWAAYAGDALGPAAQDGIEAHIRRMLASQPGSRAALETLAMQMVLTRTPVINRNEADNLVKSFEPSTPLPVEGQEPAETPDTKKGQDKTKTASPAIGTMLSRLLQSGLLTSWSGNRVSFSHPLLAAYLAAKGALRSEAVSQLSADSPWSGREATLRFAASADPAGAWIAAVAGEWQNHPLALNVLSTARWLAVAPAGASWPNGIMRQLAMILNTDSLAQGVRARAMAALVLSGNPSVPTLLRQAIGSRDPFLRQLAVLGAGYLHEIRMVPEISKLLSDPAQTVRQAACLALVAIGDKSALETVAAALMQGDDLLRRYAAEALANDVEEGHPALQEGSTVADVMVRRSVIYGLFRLRHLDWARETLRKMHMDDAQWVVQNSANEALQATTMPDIHIPQRLPPLNDSPWLITYAASKGMGIIPGKPAMDLLYSCLKDGNEEQQLAVLQYLNRMGDQSSIVGLYQSYYSTAGEVQEAALVTLWHLASAGVELPPPIQYGYQ